MSKHLYDRQQERAARTSGCVCAPSPLCSTRIFYLNPSEILEGWVPIITLQGKLRHSGRGVLTQVCLAADKSEVSIPDRDGSDALSSQPLCVLHRLALSWHQACLFSAWPGEIQTRVC